MNVFLQDRQIVSALAQELSLLGSGEIVVNMSIALLCGLLIAFFYRWVRRKQKYSANFANALVALSMITTIVITVIGNNLARAFGLVGALSIIRFRMGVKSINDIVFIFFALAVGMAAGVGLPLTAFIGSVFIGVVMVVLSRTHSSSSPWREFTLWFSFTSSDLCGFQSPPYHSVLATYSRRYELIRSIQSQEPDVQHLTFSVNLQDKGQIEALIHELTRVPGVTGLEMVKGGPKTGKYRKRSKKSRKVG